MKTSARLLGLMLAAGTAGSMMISSAAPAAADDYGTNAAIGAALGSIVGQLLFDSGRNQYYYVHSGRRVYVHDNQARNYYAHRDPGFYHAHAREFDQNRGQFNRAWHDHSGGHMSGGHSGWHH